jgi:cobalt-zinc-cadmium efflux system protein
MNHTHQHHHNHSHNHAHHGHSHAPKDSQVLKLAFLLIFGFMLVEFIGGYWFNSLALMADAGHMANDAFSLGLAWLALLLAQRAEYLSKWLALINGISLIIIALWIGIEAIERLQNPSQILALPMLGVATLGLLINIFVAKKMLEADQQNLNVRAAYLHVLADLLGSVVAIISGLSAYFLGWLWVDTVASILLSLLVLKSGIQVSIMTIKALRAS